MQSSIKVTVINTNVHAGPCKNAELEWHCGLQWVCKGTVYICAIYTK